MFQKKFIPPETKLKKIKEWAATRDPDFPFYATKDTLRGRKPLVALPAALVFDAVTLPVQILLMFTEPD